MQAPPKIITIVWSEPVPYESAVGYVGDTDFGIYAVYGPHPEHQGDALLYIGRSKGGSFGWRVHADRFPELPAECLRVSFGRLAGAVTPPDMIWNREIELAEVLLIAAHEPPLNKRVGIGGLDEELQNIHVCNWENLGAILPEVSGLRWTSKGTAMPKNIYRSGTASNEGTASGEGVPQ